MNNYLRNIFAGKKVLVTGHTGFKGAWLTFWLNMLGAKVIGISLDPEQEHGAFQKMNISSLCKDIRQNINDLDAISRVIKEHQPEIVFHLAAQALVLDSYQRPIETFQTNVIGTANILEACRLSLSVKSIVIITTDKCYENNEWIYGYRETDKLGGKDPYSASKAAAELIVNSYRESFYSSKENIGLATARAGNVIGGGDWASNRIIPDCVKSLISNKPIEVRNPLAVRPWQHVLEPLGGYLLLAAKLLENPKTYSEPWNFGPTNEGLKTVENLVDEVISCWGNGRQVLPKDINMPHESGLLTLDISKARHFLAWEPSLSFTQSVQITIDWYKAQLNGENMIDLTRRQIEEFQNLIKW